MSSQTSNNDSSNYSDYITVCLHNIVALTIYSLKSPYDVNFEFKPHKLHYYWRNEFS